MPQLAEKPDSVDMTDEEWRDLETWTRQKLRGMAAAHRIKLESGCKRCGYDENPYVLEFHHIDPETKSKDMMKAIENGPKDVAREAEKCVVLCANCHREVENPWP